MYYMAMDGGGTKLLGLLFDDEYNMISSATAQGTHISVYHEEEIREHVSMCYEELLKNVQKPIHIEKLYVICGPSGLFKTLLPDGVTLGSIKDIGEPVAGMYAGNMTDNGFLALAGTGSDVFLVQDHRMADVIGGWGAILGDEGSGVWMSRLAMSRAIQYEQGWGEETSFGEAVKKHYGFGSLWGYVDYLYSTTAHFRRVGELLPIAAQAARDGDEAMLDVFYQGGQILAKQMIAMLRKHPEVAPNITACGGAWKAHEIMAQAFEQEVKSQFPNAVFTLPIFEHIMAGPVCLAMENGEDMKKTEILLKKNFEQFIWNRG